MSDIRYPFAGFDESTYLKLNPDVLEAVQNRYFSSGWEHYISHGFRENRLGVPLEVYQAVKEIIQYSPTESVPPEHLRKRVHGDENLLGFESVGRMVSSNIYSSIKSRIEWSEHLRILDFGCGCGRVIRHFHKLAGHCGFFGTDIDRDAISWCQRQLSYIGEFASNKELPPLPFDDEFFDFVYSVSVFTHLPEDMQFAWLEELRRVTKRGSYLVLTTHEGKDLFESAPEESKKRFEEDGFYYAAGPGTEGLPDFYQTSFHTSDYIYKNWGRFFEIVEIARKGIANHQDLILCRRSSFA